MREPEPKIAGDDSAWEGFQIARGISIATGSVSVTVHIVCALLKNRAERLSAFPGQPETAPGDFSIKSGVYGKTMKDGGLRRFF